jgi:hypothetical protein
MGWKDMVWLKIMNEQVKAVCCSVKVMTSRQQRLSHSPGFVTVPSPLYPDSASTNDANYNMDM